MLKTLTALFSTKKACLRVVARKIRRDKVYYLQAMIHTWNLPGQMNLFGRQGGTMLEIRLEGREEVLIKRLEELKAHPCILQSSVEHSWLPYEKKYPHFMVVF